MQRSMKIPSVILFAACALTVSCHRDERRAEDREPHGIVTSNTHTPSTNPSIQRGTLPWSDRQMGTDSNPPQKAVGCPDPNSPSFDDAKVDPSCPRPNKATTAPTQPAPAHNGAAQP